jgi:hypothetical protein
MSAMDRPFWADSFDIDLPKVFPDLREELGALGDVTLFTEGRPCSKTGGLNHPAVWNGDHAMLAYFGFSGPSRPGGLVAPSAAEIRCTAWEAFRDAWPHNYVVIVEREPVWDTSALQHQFETILLAERKWAAVASQRLAEARTDVRHSFVRAVRRLEQIVERHRHLARRRLDA